MVENRNREADNVQLGKWQIRSADPEVKVPAWLRATAANPGTPRWTPSDITPGVVGFSERGLPVPRASVTRQQELDRLESEWSAEDSD